MRGWKFCALLSVAVVFGALGCGSQAASGVTLIISPTVASVVLNNSVTFVSSVSGTTNLAVTWSVTCAPNVTAGTCGTIDANGDYMAPSSIPSTPIATVTCTSQADTSVVQTATITIISGIAIAITPPTASVGTNETLTFTATVTNPGCVSLNSSTCYAVTWSLPTTTGVGTIVSNGGLVQTSYGVYTAPSAIPASVSVTITATSVVDPTITATASVTIVTSSDPTVTSVNPSTVGVGSTFQDVFVSGTNFIATTNVYINGMLVGPQLVIDATSSVIVLRIPDTELTSAGTLVITASRQAGSQQNCTPDVTKCQVSVIAARPAVVGPSPTTIPQGTAGALNFNVNGGYFGTATNPAVSATYDGNVRAETVSSVNDGRQLSVTIGGASNPNDFGVAGLHQVAIKSNLDPTKFAVTNLAVQTNMSSNPPTSVAGSPVAVGMSPIDVAINPATGTAVVANNSSNDVTLINLAGASPSVALKSLCTGTLGSSSAPCAQATGPTSVATATVNINGTNTDLAIVANSATKNIAVINLDTQMVTSLIPLLDSPAGVGINPVTGRALVSINSRGYGVVLDLSQATPVIVGVVSISSGPHSHVAVEPHLNWALATPGGAGSLGIVDLNRQTVYSLANMARDAAGNVTVNVQPASTSQPTLAVNPGDAVLIQGVSDNSFNGVYTVTSASGNTTFTYSQADTNAVTTFSVTGATASYSEPVATVGVPTSVTGVAINTETQEAILADTSISGDVSFMSLLDQSVTSLALEPGMIAGAFNSLTNIALAVNDVDNELSAIDPTGPARIPTNFPLFVTGTKPVAIAVDSGLNMAVVVNQTDNTVSIYSLGPSRSLAITDTSPKTFVLNSTLSSAPQPPASLPLTIFGKGFTSTSVPRLDGIPLTVTSVSSRELTATVPSTLLASARRFAVDVLDSGVVSNVSDFTVMQSIDVGVNAGTGCPLAPLPTGVAIDPQQGEGKGLAVVSLFGCNTVAIIDLSTGTGSTVPVGDQPLGVAVDSNLHSAVVANNAGGTASVVDELMRSVTSTVPVGSAPFGVATDLTTDSAGVTNSVDNTVSIMGIAPSNAVVTNTVSTGQYPIADAFDYQTGQIAVANAAADSVIVDPVTGSGSGATFVSSGVPTSVQFDPVAGNFLIDLSTNNQLEIGNPITQAETTFAIGINPTTIAYNYLTSTLVSANSVSRTLTVVDFLDSTTTGNDRRVRAVLPLPPPPPNSTLGYSGDLQLGMDIQPLTNLAVVADTINGHVLLVPLPY